MIADPVTLPHTATVGRAIETLLAGRFHHLPVIDEADRFVCLFGVSHAAKLLLPRALTMAGGLGEVSYVHESLADMNGRLGDIRARPVTEFGDHAIKTVNPDTPLVRGLQLLCQGRSLVPVVERDAGRMVGVLAFYGLLARLQG
jgi:CBS-domain-containing membrane protein